MNQKIRAAENAIDIGNNELQKAIKETFPIGAEVKSHGPRNPIECTVTGYVGFDTLQLTVKKSGAIINRKYSSVEV